MKERIGQVFLIVFIALFSLSATTATAQKRRVPHPPAVEAGFIKTCNHYTNRARFQSRDDDPTIEVILADACARALDSMTNHPETGPYEYKRAWLFLKRLTDFRATVLAINSARLFGADAGPRTPLQTPRIARARIGRITAAGEYLIAREMGVLRAFDDWARVSDFAVVARR